MEDMSTPDKQSEDGVCVLETPKVGLGIDSELS